MEHRVKTAVVLAEGAGLRLRPLTKDQPYIILDPAKAKREMGWRPRISLDAGLNRAIKYWKERYSQL